MLELERRVMAVFEQPHYSGIDSLRRALADDAVSDIRTLIVGAALYEENFDAVYGACLALAHPDEVVRGNAVLGFGHIARQFRRLGDEALEIVRASKNDSSAYVRGQAEAAAMDLRDYLGLKVADEMDVEELPDPE